MRWDNYSHALKTALEYINHSIFVHSTTYSLHPPTHTHTQDAMHWVRWYDYKLRILEIFWAFQRGRFHAILFRFIFWRSNENALIYKMSCFALPTLSKEKICSEKRRQWSPKCQKLSIVKSCTVFVSAVTLKGSFSIHVHSIQDMFWSQQILMDSLDVCTND